MSDEQCSLLQNVPIILGDIRDQASIDEMAQQSKVVIATAGPFAHYGTAVVDACVKTGTDYCDCTGEVIGFYPFQVQQKCSCCWQVIRWHLGSNPKAD